MDDRFLALQTWLASTDYATEGIHSLCGDASFRRYFRIESNDSTMIAMDAPPDREDTRPFVAVAKAFAKQGVLTPAILASDPTQGFLLLSDFGDSLYSTALNVNNAGLLYGEAMKVLLKIQTCQQVAGYTLPHFDETMMRYELGLFREWFLEKYIGYVPSSSENTLLNAAFKKLIDGVLLQPQVCVHRDYHSRNLLWLDKGEVGVLDFQDAVWGPISYDLVSLLKDCYVDWPREDVESWVGAYHEMATDAAILKDTSKEELLSWFDWTGMQRHMKALGIFARLHLRDGKAAYLPDMPRTLNYLANALQQHPQLKDFSYFLSNTVVPRFQESS